METVGPTDSGYPLVHPAPGRGQFIPRLGHMQQRLAPLLAAHGVTTTVSPLYYMGHNPELALFASEPTPMGLALDPCGHLRQQSREDRAPAFRALPFGNAPKFDPERDPVSESELVALAVQPIERARGYGATLLLTLSHLCGEVGTRGRELDLRIARTAIAHFRRQRMDEPPEHAAVALARQIYATVTVRHEVLRSSVAIHRLADAYLALDADGFWVVIEGFNETAPLADIRAGARLLALLADGTRPVVSAGAGQLHLGLLVNNFAASIGIAEAERFVLPAPRPSDGSEFRRRRSAYHPRYLRSFRLGGEAAAKAFATSECRCKRHPRGGPPAGDQVEEHAAIVRARETREAIEGEVLDRREWLLANAAMASHVAHDAGVEWTKGVVYEALFEGLDGVDEQLDLTG